MSLEHNMKYIEEAFDMILEKHKEYPLDLGDIVAHKDDDYVWKIFQILDNEAVVSRSDETLGPRYKTFPLNELVDINLVRELALALSQKAKSMAIGLN